MKRMRQVVQTLTAVAMVALFGLAGCGGGGGGGSSNGGSPAVPSIEAKTVAIGPSGGNIKLSDGTEATFLPGVLPGSTNISISKYAGEIATDGISTPISSTYEIIIPANAASSAAAKSSIIDSVSTAANLVIPLTNIAASGIKYLSVQIIEGSNKYDLASKLVTDLGKASIKIPYSFMGQHNITRKIRTTAYSIKTTILGYDEGLYTVNSTSNITKSEASSITTQTKKPIILIHGLQSDDASLGSSSAYKTTWSNFISYFSNNSLKDQYQLYTLRYNTANSIPSNAALLKNEIARVFPASQTYTILAHSMGGLVANDFIVNGSGADKLSKLITLGTPFHGSQYIPYFYEDGFYLPKTFFFAFLDPDKDSKLSVGVQDLHWDGSDGKYVNYSSYLTINNNKFNSISTDILSKYYLIAGTKPLQSFIDYIYKEENYYNDGIVSDNSALFKQYASGSWSNRAGLSYKVFENANHLNIHGNNEVLDYVKGILLPTTADVTPPTTTAVPSVSGTGTTSRTLSVTINENGTGYYLVQAAIGAAPSVAQVIQANQSFPMTANIAATRTITGLTPSTNYRIYFVAKDAANNVQTAATSVLFNTTSTSNPYAGSWSGIVTNTGFGACTTGNWQIVIGSNGQITSGTVTGTGACALYSGSISGAISSDGTAFGVSDSLFGCNWTGGFYLTPTKGGNGSVACSWGNGTWSSP